ncbi:AMP-dependent synthetase/ligase [Mesorhizobium sp. L-8-3]|uniref:AMP-dependent synthetase/ligase n=1 Tax=Mesorhizobium sp. L-8-3 TaxID=2744522 RepID=UPI0019262E6A|nr:AMP-binding protein [Mesorhizobium sp. L-8-3]BCH20371.1 long-chain-fatty-acid--CoA ligase [Mesorhizobium sp. L-8-3]
MTVENLSLMTMPQVLRHRAEAQGSALALRVKERGLWLRTDWKGYFDMARRLAIGLYALGFRPGDRLAVASDDSPEWLYADLAAQMVGGACLGIYPTNPWPELQYIVRHSRARIVVCGDQEQTDKVLDARRNDEGLPDLGTIICVDMKGMRHYAEEGLMSFAGVMELGEAKEAEFGKVIDAAIAGGKPDDVAIIVYTSGTTGMPKGAMLTHRNMLHSAGQVVSIHGLDSDSYSVLCYLPLCHVAERSFSTVMQLVTGCTVSFAESVDTVVVNLREIAPKGFLGVPRIWEKMQQSILYRVKDTTPFQRWVFEKCVGLGRPVAERRLANGGRLAGLSDRLMFALLWLVCFRSLQHFLGINRVRAGFCGGATVSPEVLLFFWILGVPVYQIYGMTESAGVSHTQRPGATTLGRSGSLIDGMEQKLAPDGELMLRGRSVFKGYLFDEPATERAFSDGWLHTGDIVEVEDGGEVHVLDRKKDILITSGGKNITPSLIENALKDSPYIREAILLGDGRNFLAALIQIDLETTGKWAQQQDIQYTTYRSLAQHEKVRDLVGGEVRRVNDRFARVENVRKFVILAKELDHDDGELTATMKVRRRIIEEKFREEIAMIYGSAA